MSTERSQGSRDTRPTPGPGALLLCRADPDSVAPVAQLLRERMLLTPAGPEWTALVPEGKPWLQGGEPVDRVLTGWAGALAVGVPWPVLALWWDADRSGYTLAAGFRRTVGYVWLANGTPAGEDEAMRTFAARLGLDPVLDAQSLDGLTRPDPAADARARLLGLLAVLTRAGMTLPAASPRANPPTASARSPASSPASSASSGPAGAGPSVRNSTPSNAAASAPGSPGPAPPEPAPWPPPNSSPAYRSRPGACTAEARAGWSPAAS